MNAQIPAYETVIVTRQQVIARIEVIPEDGGADHAVAVAFRAIGDHFAEEHRNTSRPGADTLEFRFRDVLYSASAGPVFDGD